MVKKIKKFLKDTTKRERFAIMFLYTIPSFMAIILVGYLIYSDEWKTFFVKKSEIEKDKPKTIKDDDDYLKWRKKNL